jgi:hypothetical protein
MGDRFCRCDRYIPFRLRADADADADADAGADAFSERSARR